MRTRKDGTTNGVPMVSYEVPYVGTNAMTMGKRTGEPGEGGGCTI